MAASRTNRFRRPGRSFHSPADADWSSDADVGDVELGVFLSKRNASRVTESDGEQLASSESEPKQRVRRYLPRRFENRPGGRALAFRNNTMITSTPRPTTRHKPQRFRSRTCSRLASLSRMALMTLGLLQCVTYLCGVLEALFPDELDLVSGPLKDSFMSSNTPLPGSYYHINQLTADVQPFMCHSHNDYWRREPLYQAIHAGCTGVEADIWLLSNELFVAHTPSGIRRNRTLETLYLDPLMEILDQKNSLPDFLGEHASDDTQRLGVFDKRTKQSLVLLIDFKNKPEEMWHRLNPLLESFRDKHYLTYFNGSDLINGPLTIVLSGDAPFHHIVANSTYRDMFYDAPLDALGSLPTTTLPLLDSAQPYTDLSDDQATAYSPFNSYYASTSFKRSIGYPFHSSLSQAQLERIRSQIRSAHARGLKVRYWGIPAWPIGVRNYLWRVLVREGVDYLSVDDIDDVARKDWGPKKGGWGRKWWR